MKRFTAICIAVFVLAIFIMLGQTARDPAVFSGKWYSSVDQSVYVFEDGLIYCPKFKIALSKDDYISGAYTYGKDSIFLFVSGIEGLETERELYLIHKGDGSFLCDHEDGSGTIFFIRYHE